MKITSEAEVRKKLLNFLLKFYLETLIMTFSKNTKK